MSMVAGIDWRIVNPVYGLAVVTGIGEMFRLADWAFIIFPFMLM